jgi:hypothetical protein
MSMVRLLLALVCATGTTTAWAAAIAISPTQELAFGSVVAGSGGAVTISVDPLGRSTSGGVTVVPSGTWTAASFRITGDALRTYSISLPADGVVQLTSGSNSMAVNKFTSNPATSGDLGLGGAQTVSVGATLNVGINQPIGAYSGNFTVTVNYN